MLIDEYIAAKGMALAVKVFAICIAWYLGIGSDLSFGNGHINRQKLVTGTLW